MDSNEFFVNFRYPVAIKKPKVNTQNEVNVFLEEVKSMLEINAYHENIVNLQGITYKTVSRMASELTVGLATIEVSYLLTILNF